MRWSEEEVMSMPVDRRKWYVERLLEQKKAEIKDMKRK